MTAVGFYVVGGLKARFVGQPAGLALGPRDDGDRRGRGRPCLRGRRAVTGRRVSGGTREHATMRVPRWRGRSLWPCSRSCSISTLVAIALPSLFQRLGADPAFGSGPLATVIQDLLSIAVYLAIAIPLAT